jgi:hypothetical protein
MKIKDYKCKCGKEDFFIAEKGKQLGIYCSSCGKWFKWADKDEKNLRLRNVNYIDDYGMDKIIFNLLKNEFGEDFVEQCDDGFFISSEDTSTGWIIKIDMAN